MKIRAILVRQLKMALGCLRHSREAHLEVGAFSWSVLRLVIELGVKLFYVGAAC